MKHQTQTKKKEKIAKNAKSNYKKENASFDETKLCDKKIFQAGVYESTKIMKFKTLDNNVNFTN